MTEFHALTANACMLITLNYIALKIRNRMIIQSYEIVLAPILTGIASVLMMIQPFETEFMTVDLRFAPIIMAGLRFGFNVALLSTILPSVYAWTLDESIISAVVQGLFLPAVISSFFHQREYRWGYFMLRYSDGIKICVLLFILQVSFGYVMMQPNLHLWLFKNMYMLLISGASIAILIAMLNDENKNWLQQRELELKANQDGLTRLPNFRSFMDICKKTLCRRKIAILMIDIDNFKNYNDTLGHVQGDQLLREVGELLQNNIGAQDYLARYGGEEFITMCHSTEKESLIRTAHKLCEAVSKQPFNGREAQPGQHISISIGIAVASAINDDIHRLIAQADEALYTSKHRGKNTFTFYQEDESSIKVHA